MAPGRLDNRAFTLIEILLAMAMMSIIAASLYTSLSIGFKARESAERVVAKGRAAEIAIELIKGMVSSSMVPNGVLAGEFKGEDGMDEKGYASDTLSFYTSDYVPQEGELACDIEKIELGTDVRENTNERIIYRKTTTNLLSSKTLDPAEEILCGGVRSLNLQYYDGTDWVDSWDSTENSNTLPKALEVTIVLENASNESTTGGSNNENLYTFTEIITLPCSSS
jgi:type II secretion system protein J